MKNMFHKFSSMFVYFQYIHMRGSQKLPGILWHRRSVPWVHNAWTECYWHFYMKVLQRLHDVILRKWHNRWQELWFLHHGNTPNHTSLVVWQFLAEKIIPVITQLPYSLDRTWGDFWLFATLKLGLKGAHFATLEDIISNVMANLSTIPKEAFRQCFQQWQDQWGKCVCACMCVRILPLQCSTIIPGTLWQPIVCVCECPCVHIAVQKCTMIFCFFLTYWTRLVIWVYIGILNDMGSVLILVICHHFLYDLSKCSLPMVL
jgi:hypothetical protein